jgi:hypothetical protein
LSHASLLGRRWLGCQPGVGEGGLDERARLLPVALGLVPVFGPGGDAEPPPGPQDAHELGRALWGVAEVGEHEVGSDGVEGVVRKREAGCDPGDEQWCPAAGDLQHRHRRIDAHHGAAGAHCRCRGRGGDAGSGTGIQHEGVGW